MLPSFHFNQIIFAQKNSGRDIWSIDLHLLLVKEALERRARAENPPHLARRRDRRRSHRAGHYFFQVSAHNRCLLGAREEPRRRRWNPPSQVMMSSVIAGVPAVPRPTRDRRTEERLALCTSVAGSHGELVIIFGQARRDGSPLATSVKHT